MRIAGVDPWSSLASTGLPQDGQKRKAPTRSSGSGVRASLLINFSSLRFGRCSSKANRRFPASVRWTRHGEM
jgi:hypothetical protein